MSATATDQRTETRRIGRGRLRNRSRPPVHLWIPALLVTGAVLLPLAYLALRTVGGGEDALTLLGRARTLDIVLRSLALVVTVTVGSTVLAVPLAWLTVRTDLPGRRVWAVLTALPLVIPSYIGAYLMVVALAPGGMLEDALAPLGIGRIPGFIYGLPGATMALTLLCYPYVLLTVRAALWRLDPALEETARSLGHGPWATFRRVTLPLLWPAIAAGALLVALYTLSDFGAVSILRYETFTWAIYVQYESAFNREIAAALSLVLVLMAFGLLALEARTRRRAEHLQTTKTGSSAPPTRVALGRWRWPALGLCSVVVLCALVLPMGVLIYWVVRGVSAGEPLLVLWKPALNSITAGALAAGATVLAALPLAILTVRYRTRLGPLLERLSHVGFALPGVVVALSLVFFGINFAYPLYQTLALLIFAYVVLFLPTALGTLRTSLMQIGPSLEEAARSLGKTPLRAFARVSLPLMRSGVLAGAALVFLLTMKELPATLILSPFDFKTLATSIWSAVSEAFFAQAAAPALLLILVSSVPMAILILQERGWDR